MKLEPEDVARLLDPDLASTARDKSTFWRDFKRKHGVAGAIRVADELRRQALAANPDWPSEEERAEDLATHLRVIDVLRRVPARFYPSEAAAGPSSKSSRSR